MAERERAALIARHRARLPPPRPAQEAEPARLDTLADRDGAEPRPQKRKASR